MLQQERKCNAVALTGLGLPNEMRKYIKAGCAKKVGLWNERDFGYLAAYVAHHVLDGTLTGKIGQTFTAGRLGKRTVVVSDGNRPVVVLGDPLVFTRPTSTSSTSRKGRIGVRAPAFTLLPGERIVRGEPKDQRRETKVVRARRLPEESSGKAVSHEASCLLNTSDEDAQCGSRSTRIASRSGRST